MNRHRSNLKLLVAAAAAIGLCLLIHDARSKQSPPKSGWSEFGRVLLTFAD